jgi:hypothetical protein
MHELHSRSYIGEPNELVSVKTTVHEGGQAGITVGGQQLAGNQFRLPSTAGASVRMQVALVGPQGASCVVEISVVDGKSAVDFLLCSAFNPAPVVFYDCSVAAAAAVGTFATAKNTAAVAAAPAAVSTTPANTPTGRD